MSGWSSGDVKLARNGLRTLLESTAGDDANAQLGSRRGSLASADSNGNVISRMSE